MRDRTTRTAAPLLPKHHPEHHTHTPWLSRRISHVPNATGGVTYIHEFGDVEGSEDDQRAGSC